MLKELQFRNCNMMGGGGSSGSVDYPAQMLWMQQGLWNEWYLHYLYTTNPFQYAQAYDPAPYVAGFDTAKNYISNALSEFANTGNLRMHVDDASNLVDEYLYSDTQVNAEITAYNAILDADLQDTVLPRFRRGMQDINAVNSSCFVIGQALIEREVNRNKTHYATQLRLQNYKDRAVYVDKWTDYRNVMHAQWLDGSRVLAQIWIEASKASITAFKEQSERELHIDELAMRFPYEVLNYGCNILASIGSASVKTGTETSSGSSALISGGIGAAATIIAALIVK